MNIHIYEHSSENFLWDRARHMIMVQFCAWYDVAVASQGQGAKSHQTIFKIHKSFTFSVPVSSTPNNPIIYQLQHGWIARRTHRVRIFCTESHARLVAVCYRRWNYLLVWCWRNEGIFVCNAWLCFPLWYPTAVLLSCFHLMILFEICLKGLFQLNPVLPSKVGWWVKEIPVFAEICQEFLLCLVPSCGSEDIMARL